MQSYSESRYLEAKRTVDDRSLNQGVLGALRADLASRGGRTLRVLELGAGTGTMAARLFDWQVLSRAEYVLLDENAESLAVARQRISTLARALGASSEEESHFIEVHRQDVELRFSFVHAELERFLELTPSEPAFDVLIANAFLDIVDVPSTLPRLFERAAADAAYWFSINFDGETSFLPEHEDDEALLAVYHRSMDQRVRNGGRSGDSKTGRHLFEHLARAGASVRAAGSSDWVVHAAGGAYPADEAYFLHHLIHTVESELERHAEVPSQKREAWSKRRHAEVERAELALIVHQLDFFGRVRG
jgi:SAM-dependent methyltransferase